jgi:hypothetical protein
MSEMGEMKRTGILIEVMDLRNSGQMSGMKPIEQI